MKLVSHGESRSRERFGHHWSYLLRNLKTRKGSVAKKGHSEYLITASLRMLGKKFNWSHAFGWLLFRTKRFPSVLAALGRISHGSACSNVSLFHVFIGHDTMWYLSWRFTQPRFCSILAWTYWDLEKLTFFHLILWYIYSTYTQNLKGHDPILNLSSPWCR